MSRPDWNNVVLRFVPKPHDNITGMDDIAEEYAVEMCDDATGGLIVYGKYHGQWLANPSARHVVRHLLIRLRLIDPAVAPNTLRASAGRGDSNVAQDCPASDSK